jgi:hypothetical protein
MEAWFSPMKLADGAMKLGSSPMKPGSSAHRLADAALSFASDR